MTAQFWNIDVQIRHADGQLSSVGYSVTKPASPNEIRDCVVGFFKKKGEDVKIVSVRQREGGV